MIGNHLVVRLLADDLLSRLNATATSLKTAFSIRLTRHPLVPISGLRYNSKYQLAHAVHTAACTAARLARQLVRVVVRNDHVGFLLLLHVQFTKVGGRSPDGVNGVCDVPES